MPDPSERVRARLANGASSACDGLAAVDWYRYDDGRQRNGGEPYRVLAIDAGNRSIQVSISPKGRSVRIFVDGEEAYR